MSETRLLTEFIGTLSSNYPVSSTRHLHFKTIVVGRAPGVDSHRPGRHERDRDRFLVDHQRCSYRPLPGREDA